MSVELIKHAHADAEQSETHIIVSVPCVAWEGCCQNENSFKVAYKMQVSIVDLEGIHNRIEK